MVFFSPHFSQLEDAQAALTQQAFFLFDIHQVLFHRKGILPLVKGLIKIRKKKKVFIEGIQALFTPKTWQNFHATYKSGNRITEAYLDAAQNFPELHNALLDYSNAIYTPDNQVQSLLQKLTHHGHKLFLLSNIGYKTFDRLKEEYPNYFLPVTEVANTINRNQSHDFWKPRLDTYQEALTVVKAGDQPHLAIFIDDTLKNVRAAHEAGLNAILFRNAAQLQRDIAQLLGKTLQ